MATRSSSSRARPGGGYRRPGGGGGARRPGATARSPIGPAAPPPPKRVHTGPVELPASINVKDLADRLGVGANQIIKVLMSNNTFATLNQEIDFDTAAIVAAELGIETTQAETPAVVVTAPDIEQYDWRKPLPDEADQAEERAPVVTIMGHVDHGKTSLLDAIRKANVTAREAGGITQHIGAYQTEIDGRKVTFLDTPGHEAFTAMRARGAQATDIAVIVVAADDGMMPQTQEAIDHAKAAGVPLVVAVNKMDREDANPDRVMNQLSELGVVPETWGGDTPFVPVSARTKLGLTDLLDNILIVADVAELRANPSRSALGVVVEARLDKQQGPTATVLVQQGTLNVGDFLVCGATYGRLKAMFNEDGKRLRRAEPATPVAVLGLSAVPNAGDRAQVCPDEKTARALAQLKQSMIDAESHGAQRATSLDEVFQQIQQGEIKDLNLIIKADVSGSLEPLREQVKLLSNQNVQVKVIHEGTGSVTESDVQLAMASKAIIIGFHVRAEPAAVRTAELNKIEIRLYEIIYKMVEDIDKALQGMLEPTYRDLVEGHAEVRALFKVGARGVIAGSYVLDGRISRNATMRVRRGREQVWEGKLESLRRGKDDAREVLQGFEFGLKADGWNGFEEGDIVESVIQERVS